MRSTQNCCLLLEAGPARRYGLGHRCRVRRRHEAVPPSSNRYISRLGTRRRSSGQRLINQAALFAPSALSSTFNITTIRFLLMVVFLLPDFEPSNRHFPFHPHEDVAYFMGYGTIAANVSFPFSIIFWSGKVGLHYFRGNTYKESWLRSYTSAGCPTARPIQSSKRPSRKQGLSSLPSSSWTR